MCHSPSMHTVLQGPLPEDPLLKTYRGGKHPELWGAYGDCFSASIDRSVSLAEFVVAFYIAPVFRIERLILHVLAGSPSNVGLGHKWDLSTEQVTPERAGAQRRFRLPSSPEGSPASVARTQNGGGDDQVDAAFREPQDVPDPIPNDHFQSPRCGVPWQHQTIELVRRSTCPFPNMELSEIPASLWDLANRINWASGAFRRRQLHIVARRL